MTAPILLLPSKCCCGGFSAISYIYIYEKERERERERERGRERERDCLWPESKRSVEGHMFQVATVVLIWII